MIRLHKINNKVVKPLPIKRIDPENIKGKDLFAKVYGQIGLVARKESGKTVCIGTILRECAGTGVDGDKTVIEIFADTVRIDPMWKAIVKKLRKKGFEVHVHESIIEDGVNLVDKICVDFKEKYGEDNDDSDNEQSTKKQLEQEQKKRIAKFIRVNGDSDDEEPKRSHKRKPKLIAPDTILIFDDLANELKSSCIDYIARKNRHFRTKIIFSEQNWNDLVKGARGQLDYVLMFPKIPVEKVKEIYQETNTCMPWGTFKSLYDNATKEQYNFLYVDVKQCRYRKNFSQQYELIDSDD